MSKQYIFEVVDASDDERYYSLGVFLTKDEAMACLNADEPPCDGEESVTIEVRQRKIGWHPHDSIQIASRNWTQSYDDESDEKWKAFPIRLIATTKQSTEEGT